MTKKISKESSDIVKEKIKALKQVIPECFSEGILDFEKLNITLGKTLDSNDEKYSFSWAGRAQTFRNIRASSKFTLIPDTQDSVNFDNTENIFIEGDNLETLKLLQRSYFEKIKMIYIDPPYNTGNDFIYKDNFHNSVESYLEQTGQSKSGIKLTTNPETSGRFHSDWLSMMYSRIYLARNLLKSDGVILVSINDKEFFHLRMILNEIFGEENFLAQFIWNSEGSTDNQLEIKIVHEYVVMYVKNIETKNTAIGYVIAPDTKSDSKVFKKFIENTVVKNSKGNPPKEIILPKGFPCEVKTLKLKPSKIDDSFYSEIKKLKYIPRDITKKYNITYPIRKDLLNVSSSHLTNSCRMFSGWQNSDKFEEFINNKFKPIKEEDGEISYYLSKNGVLMYKKKREKTRHILSVIRNVGTTNQARIDLENIGLTYEYPKPRELIKYLIKIGSNDNDIVLDFFAGSGTTAEAALDLTSEGNPRKFLLIQLPEKIQEKITGFSTISELCKVRIKKNIKKYAIHKKTNLNKFKKDLGFKVFKLTKSNFKIWENYEGKDDKKLKKQMKLFESPLITGYKDQDVIYECIIKEGFDLNSKIEKIKIKSNNVFKISDDGLSFYLCIDKLVKDDIIDKLNLTKDDTLICIDGALDDSKKTNLAKQCVLKTM